LTTSSKRRITKNRQSRNEQRFETTAKLLGAVKGRMTTDSSIGPKQQRTREKPGFRAAIAMKSESWFVHSRNDAVSDHSAGLRDKTGATGS